jgi:hypothetical protein
MRRLLFILLVSTCWATVYTPTAFRIDGTGTAPAALTGTATAASGVLTDVTGTFSCPSQLGAGILFGTSVYTITTCTSSTTVTVTPTVTNATATAFTILGSATYAPSAGNGWVLEIDVPTIATGGTFGNFGFSLSSNNKPSSPSVIVTVTHSGYQNPATGGTCGSTTTYSQTMYATRVLREPYPNAATSDVISVSGTTTFRLALGSNTGPADIFSGDTVTVQVANSFYTDGSSNTVGTVAAGTSVTNNSTLSYANARAIFNWTYPGWQLVTGSTLNVRGTGASLYPMSGLPLSCVIFTATDAHSHTATATVTFPTWDVTVGGQAATVDLNPVIEYVGNISTSTFTNHDQITVTFKAYPFVGTSSSVMDSSDAVYAQPTPLYAPQYYLFDSTNAYAAAGYVDSSANVTGSVTSGTLVAGHEVKQGTSNAIAYLINSPTGSVTMHIGEIVSGTANSTNTWVDQTTSGVYTPTASPVNVGSDSNSCGAALSAGQPSSPCATINGALVKMAAYNNASSTPTHNDACGTLYMAQGYFTWTGASAAQSNVTGKCWATMVPASGVSQAQVVIDQNNGAQSFGTACTSGSTSCGTPLHLKGVTVNVATGPTSIFNGITYLWLDGDILGASGTAPIYQTTDVYMTEDSFTNALVLGLKPFSTINTSYVLVRGSNLTNIVGTFVYVYTVVGNTNTSATGCNLNNEFTSQGNPLSIMPIFAFNTLYKCNDAGLGMTYTTSSILGEVIEQNLFENITTDTVSFVGLSADSSDTATPVNNVMNYANTYVGGRLNRSYNETGDTTAFRQTWAEVGNIFDYQAIKSDTFASAQSGGTVGNWSPEFGVGNRETLYIETSYSTDSGDFCNEFWGVNVYGTTITEGTSQSPTCVATNSYTFPAYKSRQAYNGSTGSGGGDYDLLSSSPAINFFPSGTNVLPYDLAGQLRNNSGWGSAGAYAQEKLLTTVFGW